MPLRNLPAVEIQLFIAHYLQADDLASWCEAVELPLAAAHKSIYNPLVYLRPLTQYPQHLLALLRETDTILSGSRAAGFFYPGACLPTSDWDFYCPANNITVARFTLGLQKLGAAWDYLNLRDDNNFHFYDSNFFVLHGTIAGQRLQVIWHKYNIKGPIKTILEFHSSIVQCYISGYAAVSMYHTTSSRNQNFVWTLDPIQHPVKHARAPHCVRKYSARGFEVVPYEAQSTGLVSAELAELGLQVERRIGDQGCFIVDFATFYLCDILPRSRSSLRAYALHSAAMQDIRAFQWSEGLQGELSSRPRTCWRLGTYQQLRASEPIYYIQQWALDILYLARVTVLRIRGEDYREDIPWMPCGSVPGQPSPGGSQPVASAVVEKHGFW
ncbi:hypothetical protein VTL71DRAFT_850 [Oculimacula yallundae]|uniref:Uncharacterized protein n=1 Tax=Oculimacula yallundae TaxID=86028 RepID=A0ABR4D195_9HELO